MAHLGIEQTPTGRALGLTNGRMMALAAAAGPEGCSMSALAARLGLPSPLATRVADDLARKGLVERWGDPNDRRRVLLHLTERGDDALHKVHAEAERLVASVLGRMTESETEALLSGLRAFLRELHEPLAGGAPPVVPAHDHGFSTDEE